MVDIQEGRDFLAGQGLNLLAVLSVAGLPGPLRAGMEKNGVPLGDYSRLVLLGHGGRDFWERAKAAGFEGDDPLDRYSRELAGRFMVDYVNTTEFLIIYPLTDLIVPLQQLGELAGWGSPSPIGSSIHPEFGLWFAYRVALLTNAELPLVSQPQQPSPCAACREKPCLSACPAGAVGEIGSFQLTRCANHRVTPFSSCAARCLSRLACPVGTTHRYTEEQLSYHYLNSLSYIRGR